MSTTVVIERSHITSDYHPLNLLREMGLATRCHIFRKMLNKYFKFVSYLFLIHKKSQKHNIKRVYFR